MAEITAENTADSKARGRPFAPGQSGNPAGRPKGSRNRATVLLQSLLDGDGEEVVQRAIRDAKRGKGMALRLVMERLIPPARSSVAAVDLPRIQRAEDVAQAASEVIAAASRGELTLAEAQEWLKLLDAQRKAIETEDLAVRLEVLEKAERQRRQKR